MSVFDPVARSALMLTELLGDLLGRVREPAKPPTDSIITAVVAGSLPPCCWGFVAGIENLLVCIGSVGRECVVCVCVVGRVEGTEVKENGCQSEEKY